MIMDNMEQFKILMAMDVHYMPSEYEGNIYHYTSPIGFQSILFGDRLAVCLWASRYDCLNDASEGTVAEEILQEVSMDLLVKKEISKEVYDVFTSVKTSRTIPLLREAGGELKATRAECNRYICSFSKNSDSLSMWNYYSKGNKYEGFNIGFCSKGLKDDVRDFFRGTEAKSYIYPVVYKKDDQKKLIERSLLKLKDFYSEENIPRIRAIIATRLLDWGLVFKKECFQHEEEVRVIVDIAKRERQISVNYRINSGYVIPYIELKIEKQEVSSVSIGPLQGEGNRVNKQIGIMKEMLNANGYALAGVKHSTIPIRY